MLKTIKKIVIFLVFVIVVVLFGIIIFIDKIEYQVTAEDLPQEVYENSGDGLVIAKFKMLDLVTAEADERYTLTEEIINLIIYDSIKENINEAYNPLGTCTTNECLNVISEDNYYLDYIIAELNDDNQMVITASLGIDSIINIDSALIMIFDIEFDFTTLTPYVEFTLNAYYLGEKKLSKSLLEMIFKRVNKEKIEESVSFGTLDLDNYTYKIEVYDVFS